MIHCLYEGHTSLNNCLVKDLSLNKTTEFKMNTKCRAAGIPYAGSKMNFGQLHRVWTRIVVTIFGSWVQTVHCVNKFSFEACFHYIISIIWTMGLNKRDSLSHCSGEVQVQNSGLFFMKRDEPVEQDEAPPPATESAAYHDNNDEGQCEFDSDESTLELGGHVPEPSNESQWTGKWACAEWHHMVDKLSKINCCHIILVRWNWLYYFTFVSFDLMAINTHSHDIN